MARNRASMREGPLAELFRATEAAQRQAEQEPEESQPPQPSRRGAAAEQTVEHVPDFVRRRRAGRDGRAPSRTAAESRTKPEPGSRRADARRAARPRRRRAASRSTSRAAGHPLEPMPEPAPRLEYAPPRDSSVVPRRDPRRRRRRRRPERGQPDDRRRHLAGRLRRRQHRRAAAPALRRAGEDPHRPRADAGPRLGRRPGDRPPRRRGELRPDQERAPRLRHGLRHRRRGRRHRHRRRAGRRADRARARRADRRHRDDAVPLRGHAPQRLGDAGRRGAARGVRHADRDPERPPARGARPLDVDGRRVPDRRRRPPPGRPGHLRPDHDAGPDQPRLRRRAHGHVRRRLGADGHRLRDRREPRAQAAERRCARR